MQMNGTESVRWFVVVVMILYPIASAQQNRDCGPRSCYNVLGVDSNASGDDIKKAYRKLAREWHPDKNRKDVEGAQERFTEISNAYEILTTERHQYDQLLRYGGTQQHRGFQRPSQHGQHGFPFHPHSHHSHFHQHFYHQRGPTREAESGGFMLQLLPLMMVGFFIWFSSQHWGEQSRQNTESGQERADLFPSGAVVMVVGLRSKPELNGRRGKVLSFDQSKGRYIVRLDGCKEGEQTSLAATSVQQIVVGASVRQGRYAGQSCCVVGCASVSEHEWYHRVQLGSSDDASTISLPCEDVILPPKTRVLVVGLKSRPQLNGTRGELIKLLSQGRYEVGFEGGSTIALHPRNCQI